jgi:hypothetical protein
MLKKPDVTSRAAPFSLGSFLSFRFLQRFQGLAARILPFCSAICGAAQDNLRCEGR